MSEHDRKRALARELIAARLGVDEKDVRVEREAPTTFGVHTQLFAVVDGEEVPLRIRNANARAASLVTVCEPDMTVGIDLRDAHPDEVELHTMKRHSHLFDESDLNALLAHWTRVQAVRDADARGTRVSPEHVRLNWALTKGWVADRRAQYDLVDLSRDGWIITLAYATP